ncbi:MAG: acyl-CoA dehydrogenase family protein [Betaproteobacteria bacterium]|nr:acyl-CoA dehydrogenase family protein [Betaproteobacteria bacterium]
MRTAVNNDSHASALRDSVAAFLARGTDIARARGLRGKQPGFELAVWQQMAEFGWLGILVPESCGGLGLGCAEMAIVAGGAARALVPEPLTAAAVLAAGAIARGDNAGLKHELLAGLVAGKLIPALAWQERAGTLDAGAISTRAEPFESAFKLNGTKNFVAGAAGAGGFAVTAQTPAGIALYWVAADTNGATLELQPLADGRFVGRLQLSDVVVSKDCVIASAMTAGAALQAALDTTLVMAGDELFGVMGRAPDMSVDYMKTRVQFGKPIGSFQALAHRAVDLHIQRELASAVLDDAVALFDSDAGAAQRSVMASRVKARCSDAGLRITREAIQIHGAIGFTDEFDAGLYLQRAMTLSAWLGNAASHRRRYAALAPADNP